LGQDRSNYRINDDGEPSGSAGRPIYGQILSADLTNVLLVVVRYYGGTKLGVPGLINAYKSTAREAIDAAEKVTRLVCMSYQVSFQYTHMNQVMKTLKDSGATVNQTDFNNACKLLFTSPRLEAHKIIAKLQNLDGVLLEEVK
jgi:putative IMPACT (imprinted ancient) family translation regulator